MSFENNEYIEKKQKMRKNGIDEATVANANLKASVRLKLIELAKTMKKH